MGGRIRLLPDGVINQIAAGEVVSRPASVLKELLENAVDAGSNAVEVQVSGAFPFTLRVSDNGFGMEADEVVAALQRHTTSKIASVDDLQRLSTYGFRGEALPSIASVSRMRIVTRRAGQDRGTEALILAGDLRSVREAGAPEGTTVEVSDLFGNVPARLKFLKSPRTEMTHLWEVFHAIAIPGEGISFRMDDGRKPWEYEAGDSRFDRALRHAGEGGKYLVRVECSSAFFRLTGWAGLPHLSRIGSSGLHFFVNGRHFRDRGVFAAVREAYRGILAPDRQPVLYLFIECDPGEVDVNVHPAKTEARFRYGKDLFELIRHAIGESLGERPRRVAVSPSEPRSEEGSVERFPAPIRVPFRYAPPLFAEPQPRMQHPETGAEETYLERGGFASLRPVGQILGTYLVCEGPGGVVIIDQHAADERIVFSRLKESYLGQGSPVQQWLVPQVVTLPRGGRKEREILEPFLSRIGFLFETFGENTFKITGGPAILGHFDLKGWWQDLCDFLLSQESVPKGIFDEDRELWRIACHASLRGGTPVEREGIRSLLQELDRAVSSHSCPHGRPVWVTISSAEMGRMFRRS
ncbi:MAG: DNA mismatch repair endonuclease MutL [Deltaproteobacteria bacterium]